MGIFDSSSSSSNITTTVTKSSGFQEIGGPAYAVDGTGNTLTDAGSIAAAFDFAKGVQAQQTALLSGYGSQLQGFAEQTAKSEGQTALEVVKWGLGAVSVIALARYLMMAKGKG